MAKFSRVGAALAAASLAVSPALAQSAVADLGRALAPVSGESAVEGDSTLLIILGVVALGVAVALLADGDNKPTSP